MERNVPLDLSDLLQGLDDETPELGSVLPVTKSGVVDYQQHVSPAAEDSDLRALFSPSISKALTPREETDAALAGLHADLAAPKVELSPESHDEIIPDSDPGAFEAFVKSLPSTPDDLRKMGKLKLIKLAEENFVDHPKVINALTECANRLYKRDFEGARQYIKTFAEDYFGSDPRWNEVHHPSKGMFGKEDFLFALGN
jgi:hypothetical protein